MTDTLLENCRVSADRITYLADPAQFVLEDGILFVFHAWSGPSVVVWGRLNQALEHHPYAGRLIIWDATETSGTEGAYQVLQGTPFQGVGDTYLVKDGAVLGKMDYRDMTAKLPAFMALL